MTRRNKVIWASAAAVGLAGLGAGAYWSTRRGRLEGVPEEALVARIENGKAKDQTPAIFELSTRGETALPRILTGFTQSQSRPQVQEMFAESVYRMKPTARTVEAMEQMARLTAGTEAGERIQALCADLRLRCPEIRSSQARQEHP